MISNYKATVITNLGIIYNTVCHVNYYVLHYYFTFYIYILEQNSLNILGDIFMNVCHVLIFNPSTTVKRKTPRKNLQCSLPSSK